MQNIRLAVRSLTKRPAFFAVVVIGVAGATALSRLVAGLMYGVSASDPATVAGVAALLFAAAAAACYVPARRAIRVNPIVALRFE
jgi:putative ABC transport system permease protein